MHFQTKVYIYFSYYFLFLFYLDYVWALRTDGTICSSNGQIILEKPRQAQYLTHASFVPNIDTDTILWSLDESCNIYVRDGVKENSQWEQLDQSQFGNLGKKSFT